MFANLITDMRYAARALLARPGFTLIALLTLALGIGANTAIFSVINGVLIKPLPYPHGERLVIVHNTYPSIGLQDAGSSIPDYLDRREAATLEDLALYTPANFNLAADGATPERLSALRATPTLFSTLGVGSARGRLFDDSHAQIGSEHVVVLSHALWRNRFDADPGVIGSEIRLSGVPYRVLGVMPEGFGYPHRGIQLYVPFAFTEAQRSDSQRGNEFSMSIGRLAPGASIEQANAEFDAIVARNAERIAMLDSEGSASFAEFLRGSGFTGRAVALRDYQLGDSRQRALLLQAAVVLVLLIAVANVANLLMTRLTARAPELSVRNALGASRGRILRSVLAESMLLALVGGALGVLLATLSIDVLANVVRSDGGNYVPELDSRVLGFALVLTLATGIAAAIVPAFALLRLDIAGVIKDGGRLGGGGRGASASRNLLVVAQISLATVLLVGAGLLLSGFRTLQQQSPGFQPQGVATALVSLPLHRYPDVQARARFYDEVLRRMREIPGVQQAGFVSSLPFSGNNSSGSYTIVGRDLPPGQPSPHGMQRDVDEQYFDAMGIRVLAGRGFEVGDHADAEPVVIVDEVMARMHFPDASPLGAMIGLGSGAAPARIVGVVSAVRHNDLGREAVKETLYAPFRQRNVASGAFVVRGSRPPAELRDAMRAAVLAVDPEQPLHDIRGLDERIAASLSGQRHAMGLVGGFAAVALALAAIGIYGVLAFAVAQRVGELGVRMAIGAGAREIIRLVLGHGARLTAAGLGIGVVAAAIVAHVGGAYLTGVRGFDPLLYLAVIVFLAVVALAAASVPAWRAARIDPMVALRR